MIRAISLVNGQGPGATENHTLKTKNDKPYPPPRPITMN